MADHSEGILTRPLRGSVARFSPPRTRFGINASEQANGVLPIVFR